MKFIIVYVLFLCGLYLLLSALFPSPSGKIKIAVSRYGKNGGVRKGSAALLTIPLEKLSSVLTPFVRLSELRRVKLEKALTDAGDPKTPEEFVATVASGCLIFTAFGLPFLAFFPLITAALACVAVYYITSGFRELYKSGKDKAKAIELELPRFASYIKQSLKSTKNALLLLERYRTDNPAFATELSHTIADIKTSSFETALLRLNSRYNSEHLSMIIHGLIGIFNGDDVRYYFDLLEKDFTEIEINRLRREIKRIPAKMRRSMVILYAAIAMIFFTPILILIIENLRQFFA